jgi:hypothetical protein
MIQADTFVGTLAIVLAIGLCVTAFGPVKADVHLRGVQAIRRRFGDVAAKAVVALIALLLLLSGVMILRDLRPGFAAPAMGNSGARGDTTAR